MHAFASEFKLRRLGPASDRPRVRLSHATVHRALRRRGLSRPPREAVVRYEWPCPGDCYTWNTKCFQRFTRRGHAVTGDRHRSLVEKRTRIGHEFAHSIVDDHSRLAYSELHRDERAATVVAFVQRALDSFATRQITPKHLMIDNPGPIPTAAAWPSCLMHTRSAI